MFTILLLLDTLTNEFQRNENHIPIPLCRLIVSCFLSFIFFIFHYPVRFFSCYSTVIHSRVVNSFNNETGILLDTLCVCDANRIPNSLKLYSGVFFCCLSSIWPSIFMVLKYDECIEYDDDNSFRSGSNQDNWTLSSVAW